MPARSCEPNLNPAQATTVEEPVPSTLSSTPTPVIQNSTPTTNSQQEPAQECYYGERKYA